MGTGLISDSVKYQIKRYLNDLAVTDNILIAKTNKATSLEWERQQKFRKKQQRTESKGKGGSK